MCFLLVGKLITVLNFSPGFQTAHTTQIFRVKALKELAHVSADLSGLTSQRHVLRSHLLKELIGGTGLALSEDVGDSCMRS